MSKHGQTICPPICFNYCATACPAGPCPSRTAPQIPGPFSICLNFSFGCDMWHGPGSNHLRSVLQCFASHIYYYYPFSLYSFYFVSLVYCFEASLSVTCTSAACGPALRSVWNCRILRDPLRSSFGS